MSQYEPERLKQLIELSCWLSKVEPNSNGFETLARRINSDPEKEKIISQKYLQNLWSQISKAIEFRISVSKGDKFVYELLHYCQYSTWEDFISESDAIATFLRPTPDFTSFENLNVGLLADEKGLDELRPLISFSKKIVDFSVQLYNSEINSLDEVEKLYEDTAYVLSYFPPKSENSKIHPIDVEKLELLTSMSRYIPVWSGNVNSVYRIKGFKKSKVILGIRGVLLSLLLIAEFMEKIPQETNSLSKKYPSKSAVNKIGRFSGLISGGDINISGKNIVLRDSHTHIHKKSKG